MYLKYYFKYMYFKILPITDRPTGVVYVGIMGMTRAVWVGQERVWVGHGDGLRSLIARTASGGKGKLATER